MKPNNMSDEELDDLFKKAADALDPTFDPQAWKAMDQKLRQGHGWFRSWKRVAPIILLVMLSGALTFIYLKDRPASNFKKQQTGVASTKENIAVTPGQDKKASQPVATDTKQTVPARQRPAASLESHNQSAKADQAATAAPPLRNNALIDKGSPSPRLSVAERMPTVKALSQVPKEQQVTGDSAISLKEAREINFQFYPMAVESISDKHEVTEQPANTIASAHIPMADSTTAVTKPGETELQENIPPADNKSAFLKSLQVAILIAPDITTVEFKNWEAISANVGLVTAIPLTQRISIVTGVIWANKIYAAGPEDYSPAAGYGYNSPKPNSIDAQCRVLDIPLDVRYQLFSTAKHKLALQAGLSSYVMLSEQYKYNYQYGGYGDYSKSWEIANQNKHWFGVQNLAINYARQFTPALAIGVQPFAKIPLTGIGAGNVKLMSLGVAFSANYTIRLKK